MERERQVSADALRISWHIAIVSAFGDENLQIRLYMNVTEIPLPFFKSECRHIPVSFEVLICGWCRFSKYLVLEVVMKLEFANCEEVCHRNIVRTHLSCLHFLVVKYYFLRTVAADGSTCKLHWQYISNDIEEQHVNTRSTKK